VRLPKEAAPPGAQTPALAARADLPDALELSGVVKTNAMFNAGPNVGDNRRLERAARKSSG